MGAPVPAELVGAAREGSGRAFEELFRALAPAVHGYLRAQGAADPADATNEVFLRVHRALPSFDGDAGGFRSWVFVIAHHLIADERRRAARRPTEDIVAACPDHEGAGTAEDAALDRLAGDGLRAVLDRLSPDQRDVLLMRFVADLSLEQVAETTGRTTTAVKALQRRGLDAVRRLLAADPARPVSQPTDLTLTGA